MLAYLFEIPERTEEAIRFGEDRECGGSGKFQRLRQLHGLEVRADQPFGG